MKKQLIDGIFFVLSASCLSGQLLAAEQVITPDPETSAVGRGQAVALNVRYITANPLDDTLTGIGLRIHWDSSKLTFQNLSGVLATNLMSQGAPVEDLSDFDSDPATDRYLTIAWVDFSGNWPGVGTLPASLFTANFLAADADFGATNVRFSYSSLAAGRTFQSTPATVNQLTAVTLPSFVGMTQAQAEQAITAAGLTVGQVTPNYSDNITAGSVISQSPDAGTEVSAGSAVNLVVSIGSVAQNVKPVPTLSGLSLLLLTPVLASALAFVKFWRKGG